MKQMVVFLIFLITYISARGGSPDAKKHIFIPNEFLQYKVSYLWLRVGTLKLYHYGWEKVDGYEGYHARIFIDSNPKIPFVKVHDNYETVMNEDFAPIYFVAREKQDNYLLKTIYNFEYGQDTSFIRAREIRVFEDREELQTDTVIFIDEVYRDAISLLFYARYFAPIATNDVKVPIIALLKKENCYFAHSGIKKEIKYRGEKIPTYYLDGKLKFIGIVGVKDKFKGWFSTDPQRVPVKAKMKAFFGSVSIELEKYTNWNPTVTTLY